MAPLLPNIRQPPRGTNKAATGDYTSYWQRYDDYVVAIRSTLRDVALTNSEVRWHRLSLRAGLMVGGIGRGHSAVLFTGTLHSSRAAQPDVAVVSGLCPCAVA